MDRREHYQIELTRSFARLVVLAALTLDIGLDNTVMWIWLAVRAAVLIEYISFSLKDELKDLIKNFLAHIFTAAVLAIGWYGAYVLFDLKQKLFFENKAVLYSTVPAIIKWGGVISLIGLTVSAVMYIIRQKKDGFI
ncbi:hypothetical protein [uncultured Ruminococcus sp.]|uniref:hypothetical protein n=1 Tax=uncultured Ruminococcus sp. TaxID=165186 RepID=UPI0025CF9E5D|nr:hypothetical protein [uncultured Ruminococcus sp.]